MAQQIIDQQNLTGGVGIGFGDSGSGRDYLMQGFIAKLSTIDAVSFQLNSVGSQGMKVWIDNADANFFPTGTVGVGIGGATEITNANLSTTHKKYTLASAVTLVPGNRYVICMAPWNTSTHVWASDYRDVNSATSNPYANGRRVHGDTAFTTFVAPDSGNADIVFATYGTVETTRFYFQNAAAPYSPATKRGSWDDTASFVDKKMDVTKSGANATIGVAETTATNNWDVLLARFVSPPLGSAKTITGVLNLMLGVLESNAAMNALTHIHGFVTAGDTDTVRGTFLTNKIAVGEWPTTATAQLRSWDLTDVSASAGDRLVIEIGYQAQNTGTTSYTGTIDYGGTGSDLTDGSTSTSTLTGFIDLIVTNLFGVAYTSTLTETAALTDTVIKTPSRTLSEAVTLVDRIVKQGYRTLSETVSLVDTVLKQGSKVLSDTVTAVDTIVRSVSRTLTDAVALADTVLKSAGRTLSDTVTLVDTFIRSMARTLTETITLNDILTTVYSGVARVKRLLLKTNRPDRSVLKSKK